MEEDSDMEGMEEDVDIEDIEDTEYLGAINGGDGTSTKILGEKLFQKFIIDPRWGVIKCNGWKGMGRWRIAEEAAKIAMKSHRYDVLIRVKFPREKWSPLTLQMGIAANLGIEFPVLHDSIGGQADENIAEAIRAKLRGKRFLLVVGEVCEAIDLGWAGVPIVKKWTARGSKVILINNATNVMPFDRNFDLEEQNPMRWVYLFLDETTDMVANSLRSNFTPDTIMGCLMCLSLFDINIAGEEKWLIRYWTVQGFIDTSIIIGGGKEMGSKTLEEGEEILVERVMKPLLKELYDRSFIDEQHKVPLHIKELVEIAGQCHLLHKFWINENFLKGCRSIAITISTENINGVTSLPPSPKWPDLSALVIKCVPQLLQLDIPPCFFQYMQCLYILDLCLTPVTTLPSSISSLGNLRLLRLRGCQNLMAIPASLKSLQKLEFLDLSDCNSLERMPEETFDKMSSLRVLDLSNSKIMSLPASVSNLHGLQQLLLVSCKSLRVIQEDSFKSMHRLQVLNLSRSDHLESLPLSFSNLVSLKKLNLRSCSSLKTGVGAHSLRNMSSLEVLDLCYCKNLEDIIDVSFADLLPKIKYVGLAGMTTPQRLSFKGCQRLEHLDLSYLESLEVLDLSGTTKLKKFQFDTFHEALPLRRWDLLPINYNGGKDAQLEWLNWDGNDVGARIWVSDGYIFEDLPEDFFKAKCFSRFHIRISSSTEEKPNMPMPMGNVQNIFFQRDQFAYKDIYPHIRSNFFANFRRAYNQCLEIFRSEVLLGQLRYLLGHTELFILFENNSVLSLTEYLGFNQRTTISLKECRIGSCQSMKAIFDSKNGEIILEGLEVVWISDLPELTTMWNRDLYNRNLAFLKHMHLERCPKIVIVFTSGCYFESLETLDIKFCSRLEVVFGNRGEGGGGSFPKLRSLLLWQLPKLTSICSGYLPKLQKMRVGGCRKLRKLPFRVHASDMVEIEGEMNWWNNLQWEDYASSITRLLHFRACGRVPVKQRQ